MHVALSAQRIEHYFRELNEFEKAFGSDSTCSRPSAALASLQDAVGFSRDKEPSTSNLHERMLPSKI
jgi:hypothetical protein